MEYTEFSGKTVDDAITEACQNLMVTSDRLDYEVVEKGSSGFLGIGTKLATIKARVKDDSNVEESKDAGEKKDSVKSAESVANVELVNDPKEFLDKVFKAMNMEVNIKIEQIGNDVNVELSGEEMGVLIGKRGQTLD